MICLGFPDEGKCDKPAGSTHSPYWCQECDEARRAHITAQLERISASFADERRKPETTP